jgi:hypothetical protein
MNPQSNETHNLIILNPNQVVTKLNGRIVTQNNKSECGGGGSWHTSNTIQALKLFIKINNVCLKYQVIMKEIFFG